MNSGAARFLGILFFCFTFPGHYGINAIEKPADKSPTKTPLLQFRFDKRIETVYFVLMLTGEYDVLISGHHTAYKSAAAKYFAGYKDHRAVQLARKLIEKGFSYDYVPNWLFQFSDFPELQKSCEVNFPFSVRNLNADTLELFRKELVNFYRDSHADSFFSRQKNRTDEMLSGTEQSFTGKELPSAIEDFYGVRKNADFYVVLSPLLHSGGFAVDSRDVAKNKEELYALIGPDGEIKYNPVFDKEFLEQDLIIHEFGHSYADAITEEYAADCKRIADKLFPPVKDKLEAEGIGKESFMDELIVRAAAVRIVERTSGKGAAEKLLNYEKSIGFSYVAEVADELKTYESQRNKYPTLKAFFAQIVKRLEGMKK